MDEKTIIELFEQARPSAEDIEQFRAMASEDNTEMRKAFAAALALPIGQKVFADSYARKLFAVDNLAPGASANYPKETGEINAIVMPGIGRVPQNYIGGDELFVPTFEIAGSVEVKLQFIRDGRFDVVKRETARLRDEIVREENKAGMAVFKAAADSDNTITPTGVTKFTKAFMNTLLKEAADSSRELYNYDTLLISKVRFADIREWDSTQVDEVTRREIWKNAGATDIFGTTIVPFPGLDDDEVYLIDTSRFGVMPIRQEVKMYEDASAIRELRARWIAFEEVGFACLDKLAIIKGVISAS